MSEFVQFSNNSEREFRVAESIGWEAVAEVTAKYGNGYDGEDVFDAGYETDLAYHNMQHTLHVREKSVLVARALGLNEYDQEIVRLAASAHDIVQGKPRGVMEQESAEWLAAEMRGRNMNEEDVEAACLAVLGTALILDQDGNIIDQHAILQAYPSERAGLIALSVACGDMSAIYASYGPLLSRDLYKELQGIGAQGEPSLAGFMQFQKIQLELLNTYRFPHPVGEALFGAFRREVYEHQVWITQQVSLGLITEWGQILEQDSAFAERYV